MKKTYEKPNVDTLMFKNEPFMSSGGDEATPSTSLQAIPNTIGEPDLTMLEPDEF